MRGEIGARARGLHSNTWRLNVTTNLQVVSIYASHGQYLDALISALQDVPADQRQELIARALGQLEQKEKRKALLTKLEEMDTDELERLVG
jgi:hypothetical protein